jgi:hypothetical protein
VLARREPSAGPRGSFLGLVKGRPWGRVVLTLPLGDGCPNGDWSGKEESDGHEHTRGRKCRYGQFGLRTSRALSRTSLDSLRSDGSDASIDLRGSPAARPRFPDDPARSDRRPRSQLSGVGERRARGASRRVRRGSHADLRARDARLGDLFKRRSGSSATATARRSCATHTRTTRSTQIRLRKTKPRSMRLRPCAIPRNPRVWSVSEKKSACSFTF